MRPSRSEEINREGLTWEEWAYAAGVEPTSPGRVTVGSVAYPFDPQHKERRAWLQGEDPTDWRERANRLWYVVYMAENFTTPTTYFLTETPCSSEPPRIPDDRIPTWKVDSFAAPDLETALALADRAWSTRGYYVIGTSRQARPSPTPQHARSPR